MNIKDMKNKKVLIGAGILCALIVAAFVGVRLVDKYTHVTCWDVKIGEDKVATFATEEEAKAVVDGVTNYYVKKDAEVQSIEVNPAITLVETDYKKAEVPEFTTDTKEFIEYIITGTKERLTYKVKGGDTIWSIALDHDFTVDEVKEMNPDLDLENIYPGDKISLYQMKPMVNIKIVQLVTSVKKIKYKTVKKKSSDMLQNTTKVKQEGKNGKKRVTELITTENEKTVKTVVKSSKVLKKPVKEILIVGTKQVSASGGYGEGKTYSGSGQAVADYALQFVGNPYVYGGTSLTNGADCSGFVLSVYKNFGVSMAHDAGVMRSYGKEVSLSDAQPGDLVCYDSHVAIYIGGGQIVHAIDYGYGIGITSVHYSYKPVLTVRRIFE